jgi:chemotaxis protein MotB
MSKEFTGISSKEKERLAKIVSTNGRSYSDPIYHANGTVNMSASRRVVIKFRLNDEDMVTEMLDVLKNMD